MIDPADCSYNSCCSSDKTLKICILMPRISEIKSTHRSNFIALLRGVNVGGNRIIKSADLKLCFEKLGFRDVAVILQSGNVKFSSGMMDVSDIRVAVETSLSKRFDYPAKAVIITAEALIAIIGGYPFDASNKDEQHYVVFLTEDVGGEMVREVKLNAEIEQVRAGKKVVYWRVQKGMTLKSDFGKLLSKAKYKEHNTVRNLNTLVKIVNA